MPLPAGPLFAWPAPVLVQEAVRSGPWLPEPARRSSPRVPSAVARTDTGNGLGYTASQPGIQSPPPGRKRRRPYGERYVRRLVASIVVAGVLAGGGVVSRWLSSDTGADYPAEWDARVQDLAEFVESERDLSFDHPVEISFLPEDEFVALFDEPTGGSNFEGPSAAQLAGIADAAGLSSSHDPVDDEIALSKVSILGFYSPFDETVVVRGDELTPAVRSVIVHELTHVLQDQWFETELGGPDDLQVRAVLEADAMRIEYAYLDTLPSTDRTEAVDENTTDTDAMTAFDDIAWALVDQRQAPYVLGPIFLDRVADKGGNRAVDAVFTDIPTSEELIDPSTYAAGIDEVVVDVRAPDQSNEIEGSRPWTMYDALLMLDVWLPWGEARPALDGWAGAGIVSYEQGGRDGPVCFTAEVHFDTPEQAVRFTAAVRSWAAASGSTTQPTATGRVAGFEACERAAGSADEITKIVIGISLI